MAGTIAIGVDIGGTFTDFVLGADGARHTLKLLTTPHAPEQAMLAGIDQLLATHGIPAAAVTRIVHGTTLATNALIERKGARVGFLTTAGFRDTLEMGNESRYDQYDLLVDKPAPLVPRALRLPITERMAAGGTPLTPLDPASVEAAAATFRDAGVEAIAIGFLHAFSNPAHEQAAADILAQALPDIPVCLSADVSPEIREYERFSTVCANAYVRPLMQRYLSALDAALKARGVSAPLLLMQSNGGLCDVATAMRYPVRLLESGPAGGAIFAAGIARELGIDKALLLDIGGTTAKLCLIDDGRPHSARHLEVARIDRFKPGSGLPLRLPVVELCEIGAGGGSIARVDRLGRLLVGPRSAGAAPGPACYGNGGTSATVTDAHAVLGHLDPTRFADGVITLQPARAAAAIATDVATPLHMTTHDAAAGIVAIVTETMATAAREHAIEVGKGLAGRALIAIGGAAGLHAAAFARTLGLGDVIVPALAGVGSAVGFLRAPVAFEKSLSSYALVDTLDPTALRALLATLVADCRALVARAEPGEATITLSAQLRYRGQGHELTVPIPIAWLTDGPATTLRTAFETTYQTRFGRTVPGASVEILGWTVRAERPTPEPPTPPPASGPDTQGPATIVETGCTILIPAGHRASLLPGGHRRITP